MNAKLRDTKSSWVDPDDTPEITEADRERGEWFEETLRHVLREELGSSKGRGQKG